MTVAVAIFLGVCAVVLIVVSLWRLGGLVREAARNRRRQQARLDLGRSLVNRGRR